MILCVKLKQTKHVMFYYRTADRCLTFIQETIIFLVLLFKTEHANCVNTA